MSNKKEAYLCVSAMLRAREPKLLNNEKAERMLDAASYEDAAKILTDCGYPDMSQMGADEVEQALAARRSEIFDELGKLAPDKELVDLFKLKYDYHNAKAILKAEAMGSDCRRLLSDSGRVPGGKLTLSDSCGDFKGGLILRRGSIEANCTAELLVDLCRGDLSAQLARVLFD